MIRNSTLEIETEEEEVDISISNFEPTTETLDLLRMFARSYAPKKAVEEEISW